MTLLDSLAQIVGPLTGGYLLGTYPLWMYGGLASLLALGALLMAFRRIEFQYEQRLAGPQAGVSGRRASVSTD